MKEQRQDRRPRQKRERPDRERRKQERRQDACEGYAYIQMVGWMDRRERVRREGDCYQDENHNGAPGKISPIPS